MGTLKWSNGTSLKQNKNMVEQSNSILTPALPFAKIIAEQCARTCKLVKLIAQLRVDHKVLQSAAQM